MVKHTYHLDCNIKLNNVFNNIHPSIPISPPAAAQTSAPQYLWMPGPSLELPAVGMAPFAQDLPQTQLNQRSYRNPLVLTGLWLNMLNLLETTVFLALKNISCPAKCPILPVRWSTSSPTSAASFDSAPRSSSCPWSIRFTSFRGCQTAIIKIGHEQKWRAARLPRGISKPTVAVLEGLHFLLGELAILGRRNGVAQGTSCLGQGAKASKSPGKSEFLGLFTCCIIRRWEFLPISYGRILSNPHCHSWMLDGFWGVQALLFYSSVHWGSFCHGWMKSIG